MHPQDSASSAIVVTLNAPHRISQYKIDEGPILGYDMKNLRGKCLQIFQGPRSDSRELTAAIKNSALNHSMSIEMNLYDASGVCRRMLIQCSPFCGPCGTPVACRLAFSPVSTEMDCDLPEAELPERSQSQDKNDLCFLNFTQEPVQSPYIRRPINK